MTFVGNDISGLPSLKASEWSYFQRLLAVIPSDGSVHFYNEKGAEANYPPIQRNSSATAIKWCVNCDILAIAWNDGYVSIWNYGELSTSKQPLKSPASLIEWHPYLPTMLTATEQGQVVAWDCTSFPQQIFGDSLNSISFTHAVWLPRDNYIAFLTTKDGILYTFESANSSTKLQKVCEFPLPIHAIHISQATNRFIVISGENLLSQYTLPPNISKISQEKLSTGNPAKLVKIRQDVIAYAIANQITISKISTDDSLILRAPNDAVVSSLVFDHVNAILYATTLDGKIIYYRSTMKGLFSKAGWANPIIIDLNYKIETAFWNSSCTSFVGTAPGRKPMIYRQIIPKCISNKSIHIWQSDPRTVVVSSNNNQIRLNNVIEQISSSLSHVMVSTDKQSMVYSIRSSELVPFSDNIATNSSFTTIYGENTYECTDTNLIVRNLQGVVKETKSFGTNSKVTHFTSNGEYICAITDDFSVYVIDISRRKGTMYSTQFDAPYDLFKTRSISMSCGGFCISITLDIYEDNEWKPAPDLFLHSPQFDKTISVPFDGRIPKEHSWDTEDPRLLCVEVVPYSGDLESKLTGSSSIFPLFVADSLDVYRQTPLNIDDKYHLTCVDLPNVLLLDYTEVNASVPTTLVLPQFEGLDSADEDSKKALMELNFHLATGDIDSAFNSIRGINNKGTWRSLAQTCAQMRRIDLADLCFGRMEDGASAILLHQIKEKSNATEIDTLFLVDTQLGIYNEAMNIAKDNRRYDLLAQLHMSLAEWNDALTISKTNDRIHARSYCYQYARSLELMGKIPESIKQYEEAGTIDFDLPRIALQTDDLNILFNYVSDRNQVEVHPKIFIWLARFFEAHNQIDIALNFYLKANANVEYLRLMCISGRWDEATKFVQKSTQRSVICKFARILAKRVDYLLQRQTDKSADPNKPTENIEKLKHQVIELFRRALQFSQALIFALDHEMIDDILSLSFSAPPPVVTRAALWFERQKEYKNAILLYSRCGHMNRALTLCFKMKQYDALDEISDNLTAKTDPRVLMKCGQYFVESERWSKAAQCFALAKQFDVVIDLCNKRNIKLSNGVIQELTEDTTSDPEVLKRLAALCEQQGDFTTASKLYLKLKDHIASIKVLIRAGDTSKVIKFAKIFRKREAYILAANYLQTLNTKDQPTIFDTCVEFYTKAQSPEKLAKFYESQGQVYIDEYQEYERGNELIMKAVQVLETNDVSLKNKDLIIKALTHKAKLIKVFIEAQKSLEKDPKKAISYCVELLRTKDIEQCMRSDDIYILMVKCYAAQGNYKNAFKILDDLRQSGTEITYYMDVSEIVKIYKAAGHVYEGPRGDENNDYEEIDDDIEDIEI